MSAEPTLLIMGLGAQMIHWDDDFCWLLAARGFRVIRFDNRDIGKSSKLTGGSRLTPVELLKLRFLKIPYGIDPQMLRFANEVLDVIPCALVHRSGGDVLERGNFRTLLIDSGYGADTTFSLDELRAMVPCEIREIVRLEPLIERLILEADDFDGFVDAARAQFMLGIDPMIALRAS